MTTSYTFYKGLQLNTIRDFNIYDESLNFKELFTDRTIIQDPPKDAKIDQTDTDKEFLVDFPFYFYGN